MEEEEEEEGNGEQLGRSGPFEGRGSLSVSRIGSSESLTAPATSFATSTPIKQNKENSGAAVFHLSPTCLSPAVTETKRLCLKDSMHEVRREGQRERGRGGREGREMREGGREGGKEGEKGGEGGSEGGREGGRKGGKARQKGGRKGKEGKREGRQKGGREGREGKREGQGKRDRERKRQRLQHFSSCLLPLPQTSSGI